MSRSGQSGHDFTKNFKVNHLLCLEWDVNMLLGIADGSKRDILDIVAINVRTEIAFGLFSDGCTSLFWRTNSHTFLAQNWDVCESIDQSHFVVLLNFNTVGGSTEAELDRALNISGLFPRH